MNFKFAVFDLDGTLLDSMKVWDEIGEAVLKSYGVIPPEDLQETLKRMSLNQSAEYFHHTFSLPYSVPQILDKIKKITDSKYRGEIELKPYARDYLNKLRSKNVRMSIATASDKRVVSEVLARMGILEYFEFVLTCSELGCSKETSQIYQAAAERWGVSPKEIIVFEDALHSIKAAKAAGFYVVGVADLSAEQDKEEIQRWSDHYIDTFNEIKDLNFF